MRALNRSAAYKVTLEILKDFASNQLQGLAISEDQIHSLLYKFFTTAATVTAQAGEPLGTPMGSFRTVKYRQTTRRNPRTGERMTVPEQQVFTYKASDYVDAYLTAKEGDPIEINSEEDIQL